MSEVGSMETGKAGDSQKCANCDGYKYSRDNWKQLAHEWEERCKQLKTLPSPDKWDALSVQRFTYWYDYTIGADSLSGADHGEYVLASEYDRLLSELRGMQHIEHTAWWSGHEAGRRGMERGGEGLQEYWRCFHCDFATYNHAEAEAHFGDRDDAEEFKPLCKWWQLMDEDERIGTLQDTIMQLNEANSAEVAVCPKCHRPHYNMEDSAACRATHSVTEGVDGTPELLTEEQVLSEVVEALRDVVSRCRCGGTGLYSYNPDLVAPIDCAECADYRKVLKKAGIQ